jgi:hypothetical protein
MPGKSTYLSDAVLDHIFRTSTFTKPTNIYVGLNYADPTDAGTNTEITGTGYARVAVASADASWTAPATSGAERSIVNNIAITFPSPGGDWNSGDPIGYFSLWDASSGWNMLYSGALGTARTVVSGDNPPVMSIGSLEIAEG